MATYKPVDLFGVPDDLNVSGQEGQKKSVRKRQSTTPSHATKKEKVAKSLSTNIVAPGSVLPGQGFLPGLSRRGRPRLAKPISAVERTAEHRRKRLESGAKRVEIILDSEVSKSLDLLATHHKEPRSEVIAMLIRKAAARLKR